MTSFQSTGQQDSLGNILSPEAKEFVPRCVSTGPGGDGSETGDPTPQSGPGHGGENTAPPPQGPINGLPNYMMTCYPFVPPGDPRFGANRPRMRGKFPQQMFMPPNMPMPPHGNPRYRFPHPGKGMLPPPHWSPGALPDMSLPPFAGPPNGMPFDGGTLHNGFVRPPPQCHIPVHDPKSVIPLTTSPHYLSPFPSPGSDIHVQSHGHLLNGFTHDPWNHMQMLKEGLMNGHIDVDDKICLKNSSIQTDFPLQLANSTLEDVPNSLYNTNKKYWGSNSKSKHKFRSKTRTASSGNCSDSENESDSGYSSALHKKNQVSNGTNPVVDAILGGKATGLIPANHVENYLGNHEGYTNCANSFTNHDSVHSEVGGVLGTSVPLKCDTTKFSYARVAQSQPSQSQKKQHPSVTTASKNNPSNCDNGSYSKKSATKCNANMQLNNVNVNVADLMKDLEKADSLKHVTSTTNAGIGATSRKTSDTYHNTSGIKQDSTITESDIAQLSSHKPIGKQTIGNSQQVPRQPPSVAKQPQVTSKPPPNQSVVNHPVGAYNPYVTNPSSQVRNYSKYQDPLGTCSKEHVNQPGSYAYMIKHSQGLPTATGSEVKAHNDLYGKGQGHNSSNPWGGGNNSNKSHKPLVESEQITCNGGLGLTEAKGHSENWDLEKQKKFHEDYLGKDVIENIVHSDNEESGGKRRRRRRRRRKKKSGDDSGGDDDGNSGANDEVTLHFEDEEEFPDLSGASGGNKQSASLGSMSYSEILRHNNGTGEQSSMASGTDQAGEDGEDGSVKESRSSRKRRKRRETANKAADVEMAEISLEQHMLEQKMKQKAPLTAKKSVSPVRNPPAQSVWKLPPSSPTGSPSTPSSSGKKVSLLLPGTVAQESTIPSSPLPSTTPVKQHGILKPSPPVSTPLLGGKKSKQAITYDLGAMIDALESKKEPPKKEVKPVVIKKDDIKVSNMLDSTAPMRRGKERETPKSKKPSPLKKVILKEREEKKRLRLLDDDDVTAGAPVGIGTVSGESDLSQDASSSKGSMEVSLGTPASAELSPISQPSPSCMSPMSPGASPLSSGLNSPITGAINQTVKLKIHSRRFREYCNQVLDKEIDNCVTALLTDLVRFQDKQFHKDPVKAKAKRRFVLGLREVTKHLKLRKVKCVVISPNLEKIQSKGGLDDALNNILELCNEQTVPFIFALGRRALGRACAKLVPVSVVGIFNYEGSEENFKSLVGLTEKARDAYREMILQIEKELAEHPPRAYVPGVPHIFAHMGHSRTPSGCSVISFTSSILSEPISENYPCSEPETDNRGYEIEKSADNTNDINQNHISGENSGHKDPYEADDEDGNEQYASKKSVAGSQSNTSANTIKPCSSTENIETSDIKSSSSDQLTLTNTITNSLVTSSNPIAMDNDKRDKLKDKNILKTETSSTNNKIPHKTVDIVITDESSRQKHNLLSSHSNNRNAKGLNSVGSLGNHTRHPGDLIDRLSDEEEDGDLDFETCDDDDDSDSDENNQLKEGGDTIEDLPHFIDSVHHFDLTEILSQHSSKTMENGEDVMSTHSSKTTHSSRTLGEGSNILGDRPSKIKLEIKNVENSTNSSTLLKEKPSLDKENRTLSWVKEAQNLHFSDKTGDTSETEDHSIDVVTNVSLECLDAIA